MPIRNKPARDAPEYRQNVMEKKTHPAFVFWESGRIHPRESMSSEIEIKFLLLKQAPACPLSGRYRCPARGIIVGSKLHLNVMVNFERPRA
jgi:hypothetical protein